MYIPKVGDVIKNSNHNYKQVTIVLVVGEFLGYCYQDGNSVYVDNRFSAKDWAKNGWVFPKEKFVPIKGEDCFYPLFDYDHGYGCTIGVGKLKFRDDAMGVQRQEHLLSSGLLFKTKEEAIECRNIMLKAIQ